ncbi:MAG: hypothetical protein ACI3YA_07735, partial [Alloprevotella sp.]
MSIRINKVIKEFNVGLQTVVDVLASKGYEVRPVPSEKISEDQYELLRKEFGADKELRDEAAQMIQSRQKGKEQKEAKKQSARQVVE